MVRFRVEFIGLALAFTIYFATLYFVFTNTVIEANYVSGPTTVTGNISQRPFPGREYISLEAARGKPLFKWSEYMAVLTNEDATPFFLFIPELNGTIWETPQGWPMKRYELGGLTDWEVYGAYTSQNRVIVEGNAFTVDRLGETLQCIYPTSIIVQERFRMPMFVEGWHIYEGKFTSGGPYGINVSNWIQAIVPPVDYQNSSIFYRVTLDKSDSIRFKANSPQPFNLKIYASVGGRASEYMSVLGPVLYEYNNVTSVAREFTATERGGYSFSFYVDKPIGDPFIVDFIIGRVENGGIP